MPFWKCYFHTIWATYRREPIITSPIEAIIWDTIRRKSAAMECEILAMDGVANHIHVAVCIPPKISAGEWVRSMKGLSSHEVNAMFPNLPSRFRWQSSYGVLTFGAKNLD